jgi:hypothetical protein
MYMTEKEKQILKQYIKKVLLESEVYDEEMPGETSLTYELQKNINKPFPIGQQEFEKIKEAIKYRYPNISSIDFTNNTIQFDKQGSPNNFHIIIRKVSNPQNSNQYRYVMWYVPFNKREDIDKPGAVRKKTASPFDKNVNIPHFLSDIYEFFIQALLMN